ncbi:hypothetical protein KGM_207345 [Danaus plexippus plexippus]|uniref:SWI/SNF-like complex subunit BAF250 C-terminal domain-containing protein n=1 Tax=Danaus plexippus plexippus TaxID=278856 RepID=A0A212EUH1_DANPL|nr:hypothetical protein KGM_207345 [Danaus plexippus plexippus]
MSLAARSSDYVALYIAEQRTDLNRVTLSIKRDLYNRQGGGASAGGPAGAPRRHPDFAKQEGYAGPGGPGGPAGAARFAGGGWAGGFPRGGPPAPAWRPPAPLPHAPHHPHQPAWPHHQPHQPHQPYHPPTPGGVAWGAPRPPQELPPAASSPGAAGVGQLKRELTFPAECIEATVPAAEKRRRLTKADVAPVDAWRIMMALKSGLLAETCWALDILNILLFDDNCIGYFGLQHMPGLLDLLLEHFQKSLGDVFDAPATESEPWRPALQVRDPAGVLKRRRLEDYEDECYTRDEPSLNLVNESRDALARRCIALSNILRGLTFVPGNEAEFSRSGAFLALAGKLLLLHHEHAPRAARARAYERAARDEVDVDSCCSSLRGEGEWWWDTLAQLREDALVCCANIAGSVELGGQPEAVARPLLDGLLHWSVCPAAVAGDPPPAAAPGSPLSPRRLALEALCKLCVTDANVDLVLATPPRGRMAALCAGLARDLCRPERPVVREFAVNLLHYLAGAGGAAAREVAMHAPAVAQLVAFIERAEQTALGVANQHGVAALRDNPDAMGTSLDMLRRAAATLLRLAEHPENRPLIRRHERRLLSLVMSQILDQKVAHELADVLFHCSQAAGQAD